MGAKLAEFACDITNDPEDKRTLLDHVSRAVRRFEALKGVAVT